MSTEIPVYAFDPDGTLPENLVTEQQSIQSNDVFDYFYIIPKAAPFFAGSVKLRLYPSGRELIEGEDYNFGHPFMGATHTIGLPIYGSISFYDHSMAGIVDMEYQTLGGVWTLDEDKILEILANEIRNPRITTWETVVELPATFPVINHSFDVDDFVGMSDVEAKLEGIREALLAKGEGGMAGHLGDKANPHETTKAQVGLGLVDNYPTAAVAEATGGIANNRFMTPLRTKQLIDAVATVALDAHKNDLNNPHQTTKVHVGLGSVQNYAIASQAEAEAGSSNARYSTPLRVREAIDALVGNAFAAHAANMANPHQVTKGQVGLGSVNDYPVASQAQAEAGTSNLLYMTPLMTRYTLMALIGNNINVHLSDYNNPHQTTKAQVGLSLVPNYQMATEAEARDATLDNRFMSPLGVRRTINELVGDISGGHATDYDNPHQVTAEQVGAPSLAAFIAALAQKLDVTGVANDSAQVFGFNQPEAEAWISTLTAGNAVQFGGRTFQEAAIEILMGQAEDALKFDGRTYTEVVAEISSLVNASSIQYDVIANREVQSGGAPIAPPLNWMKIGELHPNVDGLYVDTTLMLSGGRDYRNAVASNIDCTALLNLSGTLGIPSGASTPRVVVLTAQLRYLNNSAYPIKLGYVSVPNGDNSMIELWVRNDHARNRIVVTDLSGDCFVPAEMPTPVALADLVTVEPTDIVYFPIVEDGYTAHSNLLAQFTAFIARLDNPHQTTKAQVGLGLVSNYGDATPAEALAGTASNKFMSPVRTKEAIDASAEAILTEVTATLDDIIATFA